VVEHRYAALVRGSSAVFPRGYVWLIPLWYAALALLAEAKDKPPSWYALCALAATAIAVLTLIAVLATLRSNAFQVDDAGILLGLRGAARRRFGPRRRRTTHLEWHEIQQIRIAYRPYGSRMDVVLPDGANSGRGRIVWQVIAIILTVLIPPVCLLRQPGLLRPRSDPLRYRIPIYDVTPEQLQLALVPFAPPNLPIGIRPRWYTRVLRRLRRLGRLRRSRLTTAA
jgi:hypothetical protein